MKITATVIETDTDDETRPGHLGPHPRPDAPFLAFWLAPDGVRVQSSYCVSKREALRDIEYEVKKYLKSKAWVSATEVEIDIE